MAKETLRKKFRVLKNDASGLVLQTPQGQITLTTSNGLELHDANGNALRLEASGITISAAAKVTVQASIVEVSAAMLVVNAAMSKFSGVVQADTVITNSVISASYTPGSGNVL